MNYNQYEEEKENRSKGSLFITLLVLLILLVLVFGVSFATITFTSSDSKSNTLRTGELMLTYTENTNGISIENALPISDDVGIKLSSENEYFDFTVGTTIHGKTTIQYEISEEKDVNSTLAEEDVKLYLERKVGNNYETEMSPQEFTPLSKKTRWGTPKGSMLLTTGKSSKTETIQYRLRMWVRKEATLESDAKTFIVHVNLKGGVLL